MMTTKEWNEGINFLTTATEGCWIEEGDRQVEVVDMCGGRYLCLEAGEVVALLKEEWRAMSFLSNISY